jgi:hypothetical protein
MSSKKLTFSINYSSSFFYRTVCTKCGGGPSLYSSWREVKKSPDTAYSDYKNDWQSFIEWFSLLMRDHYLFCEPKKITKMHAFNVHYDFTMKSKYFSNKHFNKGVEYAFCSCRKTIWVFAERYCNKPESINRRSRYSKALKSMRRF